MDTTNVQRVEKAWMHNPTGHKVALVSGRGPRMAPDIWEAEPGESIEIPRVYVPAAQSEGFALGKAPGLAAAVAATVEAVVDALVPPGVVSLSTSDEELAANLRKKR